MRIRRRFRCWLHSWSDLPRAARLRGWRDAWEFRSTGHVYNTTAPDWRCINCGDEPFKWLVKP